MTKDLSRRPALRSQSDEPSPPARKIGHFTQLDALPAPVQRRADDRGATRDAASVDAPAAESIEESHATLPLSSGGAPTSVTRLTARQLQHARHRNVVEQHRLRFNADAFSDAAVDSDAFAHAVAAYQADAGLEIDGIAGPETCAHKGCIPREARADAPTPPAGPVDRSATRAPASIDAPAADSIEDHRDTLPLQLRANDAPRSADDTHAIAATGVAGAGGALPHADAIKQSFGAEHAATIDGIDAHVGGAAADAARAIGASAYATGGSVAFASSPDLHTAAHEAAHVVQQRRGVQLKGDVGEVNDPYEQHADAVAARVVAGRSARDLLDVASGGGTPAALQRKEGPPEAGPYSENLREDYRHFRYVSWPEQKLQGGAVSQDEIFTGGSGKATPVGGKSLGDAGFGAALGVGGSQQAEAELKKGSYGVTAAPVAAHTENLDFGMAEQARFIEENAGSKGEDWISVQRQIQVANAKANLAMLERHEFEQWYWVNAHNQWAPFANTAGTARADLIETAALMGFDLGQTEDVARFIKSVEQGLFMANDLVDAKVLGKKHDTSWTGREGNKGALGAGPELKGESITPLVTDLQHAYAEVTGAQYGVYQSLLAVRAAALKEEKDEDEGKLAEINEVIAFWTNMAGMVDGHAKAMKGVVTGEKGAELDNYANRLSVHAHAVRSWNSAGDRAEAGEATALQSAELTKAESAREYITGMGTSGGMDLSISGVVDNIVTFLASGQIEALMAKIETLDAELDANHKVSDLAGARDKLERYKHAIKDLQEKAERMQAASVANREAQYLDAGDSLDRYARAHASALHANDDDVLAPKDDKHEIYSTLMVVVAKIRAYMLMADSARGMFSFDDFIATAYQLDKERRDPAQSPERQAAPRGDWSPPSIPEMGKEEMAVWHTIDGDYAGIFGLSEKARIQFELVVELVTQLLQKMKGTEAKTSAEAQNEY